MHAMAASEVAEDRRHWVRLELRVGLHEIANVGRLDRDRDLDLISQGLKLLRGR